MRFILLTLITLLFACSTTRQIPLKSNYPETPVQTKTSKSFDEILQAIKSALSKRGIAVKEYSKMAGEIVTERVKIVSSVENKDGALAKIDAEIVYPKRYSPGANKVIPMMGDIYGEWTINVITDADSSVVLIRPTHLASEYKDGFKTVSKPVESFKTTGKFETYIISNL